MYISRCKISNHADRVRATWLITLEKSGATFEHTGSKEAELWIEWPNSYYSPETMNNDAALIITLPLAMRMRERINSVGEISSQLILNTLEAMHVYKTYFPDYVDIVPLEVIAATVTTKRSPRMASFFSGGVDSLFNISETIHLNSTHKTPKLTDLWLVRGMDINLRNDELWAKVKKQLWRPEYLPPDAKIIDIWTNARDLHGRIVGWEEMGFGPILGGISKCFANVVGQVLIGSYAKYSDVGPHSSSPLVDPMWSCDLQTIRHFSCRTDRSEKVFSSS